MAISSIVGLSNPKEVYAGQRCGANYNLPDVFEAPSSRNGSARFGRVCSEHEQCLAQRGYDKNQCDLAFLEGLEEECDRAYGRASNRGNDALSECYAVAEDSYEGISRSRYGSTSRQAQANGRSRFEASVNNLYREMLGRDASVDLLNDYAAALDRGWSMQRVREDIANSREAERAIEEIYEDVLDRDPDNRGIRTYQGALARGWSLQQVREDVADSQEAENAINRLYRELLGRNGDRNGIRTYKRALAEGRSLREVRRDIQNSDEAKKRRRR